MKIKDIQLDNRNANKGTARGQKQIVGSIQRNGFGRSGLLDKNGKAIAGNKTTEAAAEVFGVETEPIIVQTDGQRPVYVQRTDLDLDDPDPNNAARRLAYEDNLASHFSFQLDPDIVMADIEAGFNFEAIDISLPDLGEMLEGAARELLRGNGQVKDAEPQIDKAAQLKEQWGTRLGQVWEMPSQVDGRPHRIVCGDCTDRAVVEAVMRGERAEQMVTDPPYGVEYEPLFRERALGASDRRAQVVRNDDVSSWKNAFELFTGDIAYVWHADKQAIVSGLDLEAIGFEITATIIWKKPHSPFGQGHYNYQHEPCWYANRKGKNHQWAGGKDSTVWEIALDETAEGGHGTQKPLECMARPIKNHTASIVYDPFLGSGTTLIAAHNLHRIARGIEIDPGYVAVTLQRYQDATGIEPRLIG